MGSESAIYCWNPATGEADMLLWPQDQNKLASYECTFGACDRNFNELSAHDKLRSMLAEVSRSVQVDGIKASAAIMALAKVQW